MVSSAQAVVVAACSGLISLIVGAWYGRGWIRKRSIVPDHRRDDRDILAGEAARAACPGRGASPYDVSALRSASPVIPRLLREPPAHCRTVGLVSGAAGAGAALVLLAGATLFLSRDDAAVSVESLLAQAGSGLRSAGIGPDAHDPGIARLVAPGEEERGDLAVRSRRLTAEMEALDRAVVQRRDELDVVGASVARLRLAADADHEARRAAEAFRASADAGAAEARAGIEAVGREMAALRGQVAEQREALAAARTEVEAARTALVVLRAEIAEQAGRMEAARAEGASGIRQVADRLSELGQTARSNREAIGRIAGTIDTLKVSFAGTPDPAATAGIAPDQSLRTEAALRPEQWQAIQRALAQIGHYAGETDGRSGEETRAAIAKYQRGIGAAATGRLSPAQIARLLPLAPVRQPVAAR